MTATPPPTRKRYLSSAMPSVRKIRLEVVRLCRFQFREVRLILCHGLSEPMD